MRAPASSSPRPAPRPRPRTPPPPRSSPRYRPGSRRPSAPIPRSFPAPGASPPRSTRSGWPRSLSPSPRAPLSRRSPMRWATCSSNWSPATTGCRASPPPRPTRRRSSAAPPGVRRRRGLRHGGGLGALQRPAGHPGGRRDQALPRRSGPGGRQGPGLHHAAPAAVGRLHRVSRVVGGVQPAGAPDTAPVDPGNATGRPPHNLHDPPSASRSGRSSTTSTADASWKPSNTSSKWSSYTTSAPLPECASIARPR